MNGPGGGDSDLGQPIFATADGVVTFSGQADGTSWGNVVTLWHGSFGSRYGHCQKMIVNAGDRVKAGQVIAFVGKGYQGRFPAHLHFDIFKKKLPTPGFWTNGDKELLLQYFVDPWKFLKDNHAKDFGET